MLTFPRRKRERVILFTALSRVFGLLFGLMAFPLSIMAASPPECGAVNEEWAQVLAIADKLNQLAGETATVDSLVAQEELGREFRTSGLKLFHANAQGKGRWVWLKKAHETVLSPQYWRVPEEGARAWLEGRRAEVDWRAKRDWAKAVAIARFEFFASSSVGSSERATLRRLIVESILEGWIRDQEILREEVFDFAAQLGLHEKEQAVIEGVVPSVGRWGAGKLTRLFRAARLSQEETEVVAAILTSSGNADLEEGASAIRRLNAMRRAPQELRFVDWNGREKHSGEWRGKVLLLEFWSTGCKSCVEQMPSIRGLLERYSPEGFDVVSICIDYESRRGRALTLAKKGGIEEHLAWSKLEPGMSQNELTRRLGIYGVPTYILIDRSGKLVDTGYSDHGWLLELKQDIEQALRGGER